MNKQPLVTISIPTFNSAIFIERCLHAIRQQTYKNIEINLIDGGSSDATLTIAKKLGVENIADCRKALLKAREVGVMKAKGKYTLLLDSDQILEPKAIERAVNMAEKENLDMLVLEEGVFNPTNWLEKLFHEDRKLVHKVRDFDPYTSVMLPRFYRTSALKKGFKSIPKDALENVGGQDHAIIYFEVWQWTHKVDLLSHAVKHIEPSSLKVMVKKFYRWGYTSKAAHHPRYNELLAKKERFRKGLFSRGTFKSSIASITLLLIKGVPYSVGKLASSRSHK